MMSVVPGGAGVGRAGAGNQVRGSGSGGASLAPVPGACTRSEAGAGFGPVMQAAMAGVSPAFSEAKPQAAGAAGLGMAKHAPQSLQKPRQKPGEGSAEPVAQGDSTKPSAKPEWKPGGGMAAGTKTGSETRTETGTKTGTETETGPASGATAAGSAARAAFAQVVEAVKGRPFMTAEPVSSRSAGSAGSGGAEKTGDGTQGGTGAAEGRKAPGVDGLDVVIEQVATTEGVTQPALTSEQMRALAGAGKANAVSGAVESGAGVTTGEPGAAQGGAGTSAKDELKKEERSPAGTAGPGSFLQAVVLPVPAGTQAVAEGAAVGAVKTASLSGKANAEVKPVGSSANGVAAARDRSRAWAAVVEAVRGGRLPGTEAADGEKLKAGLTAFAGSLMGKDAVSGAGAKILAKQGSAAAHSDGPGAAPGAVFASASGSGSVSGPVPGLAAGSAGAPTGSGHAAGLGTDSQAGSGTTKGVTATGAKTAVAAAAGGNGSMVGNGFTATLLNGHPGAAMAHSVLQHGSGTASGVGTANPYTRMDEPQRPALIYASPQKMAVAVSDPALGNFQVRAQGAGAQVAASLATSSAATHAQLSGHLPSLTAFLQDQRVDVSRVTVVQQNLLGGDAGARDSGGRQQGRSGSRRARPQAGTVGEAGSIRSRDSEGSMDSAGRTGMEAATGMDAKTGEAGGGFSYVDLHA